MTDMSLPASALPQFQHDCGRCDFLGQYVTPDGRPCDLYACTATLEGGTVIARWSDEPADYMSGLVFARNARREGNHRHPLAEALARAERRGLIKATTYFIGVSKRFNEQLWADYVGSPYYRGRPRAERFTHPLMDDEAYERAEEAYHDALEAYDDAWFAEHGALPSAPDLGYTYLFDDKRDADRWCGAGSYLEVEAHSREHARELLCELEPFLLRAKPSCFSGD